MPRPFSCSALARTRSASSGGWRNRRPVWRKPDSSPVISGNRRNMSMLSRAQVARKAFV
jgi:hypothetical protein